ncbi:hypothetical protein GBP51_09085 [Pediococcus acidilactici]|nr:hypothetical protein GBP12_09005 [Pediococcus acidilactici]KAF0561177.1 hypothetical protein GBP51_09085 [Pediococcus acidilactici]
MRISLILELIAGWAVNSKIGLTGEDWWLEFILAILQRRNVNQPLIVSLTIDGWFGLTAEP